MNLPKFGVNNPVPINLLMAGFIIAGVIASFSLRKQFFPDMNFDSVSISMAFPGASPEEIEDSVAIRIENALFGIDAVDEIYTTCVEGNVSIAVSFKEGTRNIDEVINQVRRTVDRIQDLPSDVERPIVRRIEPTMPVIMVQLWGNVDKQVMKRSIRDIRDDLRSFSEMGSVIVGGDVNNELTVEVNQDKLIEHGISIADVSDIITNWMRDIPAGTVRSLSGDIVIRTESPEESSAALEALVIRSNLDGETIYLGDLAIIRTTLVDTPISSRFNGEDAMYLFISKSGEQDIVKMAEIVRAYSLGLNNEQLDMGWIDRLSGARKLSEKAWKLGADRRPLAEGLTVTKTTDLATFVEGRLRLLTENAMYGGVLVFFLLFLALSWRVALWVGIGLITALCGTLVIMAALGITLNMLTMFGLILVLGLLVDDAIVVAENIKAQHERGVPAMEAAVKGTSQVLWPVVATVLTSIVAFLPLTFIKGNIGDMLGALPFIIACALAMSLFEALLILPGHLGHSLEKSKRASHGLLSKFMRWYEGKRDQLIHEICIPWYVTLLGVAIKFRYISLTVAVSILIFSFGLLLGGRVGYEFMTIPDAETIAVSIRMPEGTPFQQTTLFTSKIEEAASKQPEVKNISSSIGLQMGTDNGSGGRGSNLSQLFIELVPSEYRTFNANEVTDLIRQRVGDLVHFADSIKYEMMAGAPGGADITIQLRGEDIQELQAASAMVRDDIRLFTAVQDITDDSAAGQRELRIKLREAATNTGLTLSNLARQVRGAVFGLDAHVFASSGEEVEIKVKLDGKTRSTLGAIENLWVVTPAGESIPLVEVAEITEELGYSSINRVNRHRAMTITADTAESTSPESVYAEFPFTKWIESYPSVEFRVGGRQEQEMKAFSSLPIGFAAACLMIYIILAWLFGSYLQPLIVMLGIPFALIGVIWGHYIVGLNVSFLSMIGFVALSGVVVNDSLILVEFYNGRRETGEGMYEALLHAGAARLRPIFLTTVTTVLGLTPLMLEKSMQAQFLVPMAIAIAFGLISATFLILLLLPALLVIGTDIKSCFGYLFTGKYVRTL